MATIVEHVPSKHRYVLVGCGYGAFQSSRPNMLLGDILPSTKQGHYSMVAVAGTTGEIAWVPSEELRVVTIDGRSPSELLST